MSARGSRFKDQPALLLLCILLVMVVCVIGVGVFMLSKAGRDLQVSDSFSSGSSPGVADNVSRGWLPGWFPQSASDIEHTHDLDTNLSLTHFILPAMRVDTLVTSSCLEWRSSGEDLFIPKAFPGMEGWSKDKISAGIRSGIIRLYECNEGERDFEKWILAIEQNQGRDLVQAYVWNNLY